MLLEKASLYFPIIVFCLLFLFGCRFYFKRKLKNRYIPIEEANSLQESVDNLQTQYGILVEKILAKDEIINALETKLASSHLVLNAELIQQNRMLKQELEALKLEIERISDKKILKIR